MARTFRATLEMSEQGQTTYGRVAIASEIVDELGLRPGDNLRVSLRGTEFTGRVSGSLKAPSLLLPLDIIKSLGLREGQGVRVGVLGRA